MNLVQYTATVVKLIKLLSWPVGSIYTSTKPTDPHELFGGTWEPIQDVFLYCAGLKHAAGEMGGEETHKLTVEEMPSHSHESGIWVWVCSKNFNSGSMNIPYGSNGNCSTYDEGRNKQKVYTFNTGGGAAHNNMPPYKAVYAWERVK